MRLKGRVACEIHTHELLVTELLIRNTLDSYEPAEIAALLSPFVFQQVSPSALYEVVVWQILQCVVLVYMCASLSILLYLCICVYQNVISHLPSFHRASA